MNQPILLKGFLVLDSLIAERSCLEVSTAPCPGAMD